MSIRVKLLAALLAFGIIPMVLLGMFIFMKARGGFQAIRIAQLETIADLKKDKIEFFFRERTSDILSATSFRNIRQNLPVLDRYSAHKDHPEYIRAWEALDDQMKQVQEAHGYLNIMLANAGGTVLYVSDSRLKDWYLGGLMTDKRAYEEGKKRVYFTDIFRSAVKEKGFEMMAVAPATDLMGDFIGEIIIEIDMEPIYVLIRDTTGLGHTGEELIAKRDGDTVLYLSPIRSDPDAALKKRVPFSGKAGFPAQRAVLGESGSGLAMDYSGVEVLAAWRYIPSLRWGLVTKIAASEAFAPVSHLKKVAISLALSIMVLGIVAALLIAKSLSDPIKALQEGAEIIGKGDLQCRVGSDAKDEIGQLSRVFDCMTVSLAETNAALKQKAAELEAANKELEGFSYSVSHDLRAPLRHMAGFMELLRKKEWSRLDETSRRYVTVITEASKKMGRLIDDLLSFSRIGRSEMHMAAVDFGTLVRETVEEVQHDAEGREVSWTIGELPDVKGDAALLRLMLVNLFSNALKFTRTRTRAEIEMGCTRVQDEHVFFIRDNGVGFDAKYSGKLFGVFQRLHRQDEFEGTGIGLANVQRIVSRHGGRIWAEGTVGQGATFYFTLSGTKEAQEWQS
ncbi:MAG TPA: ATP-binding protein [Thermodesulfovibrionales bacterium]|nr:ATP-binding protein [Thermodesulfovibrionales bacterium]